MSKLRTDDYDAFEALKKDVRENPDRHDVELVGEFEDPAELLDCFDPRDLYIVKNSTWGHGSCWVVKYNEDDNRYTDETVYTLRTLNHEARELIEALGIQVK